MVFVSGIMHQILIAILSINVTFKTILIIAEFARYTSKQALGFLCKSINICCLIQMSNEKFTFCYGWVLEFTV